MPKLGSTVLRRLPVASRSICRGVRASTSLIFRARLIWLQAKHTKAAFPEALVLRHMAPILSVLWHVCASWAHQKWWCRGKRLHSHVLPASADNVRCMDVPLLLSWLSARQYAPEGGFSGRTNKLVDGCYSHWVGTCWPLVQSALNGVQSATGPERVPANLYSREGLTRYILGCCQSKYGGLRDKPGKYATPFLFRFLPQCGQANDNY